MTANAPGQAYLQGTGAVTQKPKLAKEPALFQRSRDTAYLGGHRLSIQNTKTKDEHTTGVFILCWQT